MPFASLGDVATYAPVAFVIGVVVGLALASRWRIVRVPPTEKEDPHE